MQYKTLAYQHSAGSPARLIALSGFAFLLVVVGLAALIYKNGGAIVRQQTAAAEQINTSGKQRMLSQRAAYFATEYARERIPSDRVLATESLVALQKNHAHLLSGHRKSLRRDGKSVLSQAMQTLFFDAPARLDERLSEYVELVNTVLSDTGSSEKKLAELKERSQEMLALFDAAVGQFERESKSTIAELIQRQAVIFGAILLFVFVQAVLVTRPLLRASEKLTQGLKQEASTDYLTGLYNRRVFRALAEQAMQLSLRNEQAFSLILLDIDNFKKINDRHGHGIGDEVIQSVAQVILSASRKSDEVFRFGGEEFTVILPQTDAEGARLMAEKIRKNVERIRGDTQNWPKTVTISAGVSTLIDHTKDLDEMLKLADVALYEAKSERKNKVVAL